MFNLKYFVPVLALAAMALPAGASTLYCQGSCGSNNISAFNSLTSDLGQQTPFTFSAGGISINGDGYSQYSDSSTNLAFVDVTYPDAFNVVGTALVVPQNHDSVQISVPSTLTAVVFDLSTPSLSLYTIDGVNVSINTTAQIGVVSESGSIGTINITYESGGPLTIEDFNAAPLSSGGPGNGETPEVTTFILIGSGLLAMRWMRRAQRFFRTPQPVC